MRKDSAAMAALLFAVLVLSRWVPHPINFTALIAISLFAGSLWKNSWRFAVPLAAMFLTDAFFGFYPGIVINYIGFALIVLMAPQIQANFWTLAKRGVAASLVFFFISNFGVWLQAGLYPQTLEGLETCYLMGLPFLKNTLLSTWFYSFVFYGSYRLLFAEEGFAGFVKWGHGR